MPTLMTMLKQFRPGWPALLVSSLLLNAVLGCCMLMPKQKQKSQTSAAVPPPAKPMVAKTPARPFPSTTPFHWSRLDAPDFPTYAKNLRAIGCPEATIRDILAGELDEVYRQKEAQGAMQSGRISGMMTAAERERQQTERDQVLAQVMQTSSEAKPALKLRSGGGEAATASGGTPNVSGAASRARAPTVVPAAFTYGAPAGATTPQGDQSVLTAAAAQSQLPPNTAASLQQMQGEFASALGVTTQSPNSTEYQDTWNQATRKSDDHFSSLFGGDVYVRTQMDAVRAAAANSTNTKP